MKKSFQSGLMACLSLVALASCQDFDGGFDPDQITKASYAKHFEETFGTPDPNQDWSMATLVKANVNLPGLTGTAKMNICTGDPRLSSTRLLAQTMLENGQAKVQFDAIKGQKNVFVSIVQDGQYKVFGNYEVVNGQLLIGEFETPSGSTRAFSASCPTETDGDAYEIGLTFKPLTTSGSEDSKDDVQKVIYIVSGTQPSWGEKTIDEWITIAEEKMASYGDNKGNFQYNDGGQPFLQSVICTYDEGNAITGLDFSKIERNDIDKLRAQLKSGSTAEAKNPSSGGGSSASESHVTIQYLKNIETAAAQPWIRGEGYSLYGKDGFFEEYKKYYKTPKIDTYGSTSEAQVEMIKKIEADFEIITTEAGVVSVPFIYGATSNQNQLGYIICDPDEDPLEQTHYVLINDARPNTNIYQGSWKGDDEENKSKGFNGTSIYDSFIKLLKEGDYNPYDHKDDPITCNCTPGTGIWSEAYGTGESNGEDREGSGVYSSTMKHLGCNDPMQNYIDAYNIPVYGTEYHLSYWDEESKQFTYTVPAGKKIVFFLLAHSTANGKVASTYNDNDFTYSQPSLNKRVHKLYYNEDSPTFEEGNKDEGHEKARGAVGSTAWKVGETIYMGFGDGGNDEDLNDLIFVVKGGIRTNELVTLEPIKWHLNYEGTHDTSDQDMWHMENLKVGDPYTQPSNPTRAGYEFMGWAAKSPTGKPIKDSEKDLVISGNTPQGGICYFAIWKPLNADTDPEYITWMFACEDLGGTFDYDFNDVVWEIRHDKTNAKVEVRIVAAGGTLPFTLKYKGSEVMTKEQAFGSNSTVFINPTPTDWKTVETDVDADWSVTTHSSDFSVLVIQKAGDDATSSTVISVYTKDHENAANNTKTPQILVLPEGWQWPDEGQGIGEKYPSFKAWVSNAVAAFDWKTVVNNGNQESVEGN